jgi:hypothetical protein
MRKKYVITVTGLLALGTLGTFTSAQAPASIDKPFQEASRRPETQAVVVACGEQGRQADTRHTLMVFQAAQEILKIKASYPEIAAADPLTTEVAAMLHDIGGGGLANAKPGSIIAREVLTSLKESQGFSDAFIDKISRIVETHHVTGTVKGKDDGPEWYVVLLADTPKIYSASSADREAFARLIRERIDALKAAIH